MANIWISDVSFLWFKTKTKSDAYLIVKIYAGHEIVNGKNINLIETFYTRSIFFKFYIAHSSISKFNHLLLKALFFIINIWFSLRCVCYIHDLSTILLFDLKWLRGISYRTHDLLCRCRLSKFRYLRFDVTLYFLKGIKVYLKTFLKSF